MEPAKIPCVSAQWTHEAAREGRPVSEHPEGMNGGPRGKDLTQGSLIVSRYSERLAWHDFWQPIEQCGFINSFSHYHKGEDIIIAINQRSASGRVNAYASAT